MIEKNKSTTIGHLKPLTITQVGNKTYDECKKQLLPAILTSSPTVVCVEIAPTSNFESTFEWTIVRTFESSNLNDPNVSTTTTTTSTSTSTKSTFGGAHKTLLMGDFENYNEIWGRLDDEYFKGTSQKRPFLLIIRCSVQFSRSGWMMVQYNHQNQQTSKSGNKLSEEVLLWSLLSQSVHDDFPILLSEIRKVSSHSAFQELYQNAAPLARSRTTNDLVHHHQTRPVFSIFPMSITQSFRDSVKQFVHKQTNCVSISISTADNVTGTALSFSSVSSLSQLADRVMPGDPKLFLYRGYSNHHNVHQNNNYDSNTQNTSSSSGNEFVVYLMVCIGEPDTRSSSSSSLSFARNRSHVALCKHQIGLAIRSLNVKIDYSLDVRSKNDLNEKHLFNIFPSHHLPSTSLSIRPVRHEALVATMSNDAIFAQSSISFLKTKKCKINLATPGGFQL